MKIVVFHVDNRKRSEKVKAYTKLSLKVIILILILTHFGAGSGAAVTAYKAGNILELIPAIPMP